MLNLLCWMLEHKCKQLHWQAGGIHFRSLHISKIQKTQALEKVKKHKQARENSRIQL